MRTREEQAARYLRLVWQGHDELDADMCLMGAFGLYDVITNCVYDERIIRAARRVQQAFWLSDQAEKHQGKNENLEYLIYKQAEEELRASREIMGLETESVKFTIAWWQAYRHKDKEALFENLVQEHLAQFRGKNKDVAKQCASLILKAAAEHKKKDWVAVDKKLEKYFKIYLPHL